MKMYIHSTGNISPQHSLYPDIFFQNLVEPGPNEFPVIEPDYDLFVDPKMIRRMSRIVKMGVASALTCLRNAGIENPSALLTATAYGCLEDSSSFLRRMIEFDEKMLSPTAFIQSTHNTVGAQIALLIKCHNYNNTIVHRSFSFENALVEANLLLEEGIKHVLVGAIDENTRDRQAILSRFGLYKSNRKDAQQHAGNIAGEGAAFFLLNKEAGQNPLALIRDLLILFKPEAGEPIKKSLLDFLKNNRTDPDQVDLVLTSQTGNQREDIYNDNLLKSVFPGKNFFPFKSLCGDYPTASGFAVWLATLLLSKQEAPSWMQGIRFPLNNIVIHHRNGNAHHSFILISSC
jgi:3-oxoacyl-[acyl-carrier-protein] synthase II